jgi:hypothetical protein
VEFFLTRTLAARYDTPLCDKSTPSPASPQTAKEKKKRKEKREKRKEKREKRKEKREKRKEKREKRKEK